MTPARLSWRLGMRMSRAMRTLPLLAFLLLPAIAQAAAPKPLGSFEDWQAATFGQGPQTVCYAFTHVQTSAPDLSGRGTVMLTVTQRPGARDEVSIATGIAYAKNAAVSVQAAAATLDFYTAARAAYARDGHASVVAFQKAATAVVTSPRPKGPAVVDTFSLRGFNAAYKAIDKACPGK